jgi:hypothetical protein
VCVRVQDLAARPVGERVELLTKSGAPEAALADGRKMLLSLPHVHVTRVKAFVEEEDDIKEGDVLTVQAWIAITRASHAALDGSLDMRARRAGVQAFAPRFPHTAKEKWCARPHSLSREGLLPCASLSARAASARAASARAASARAASCSARPVLAASTRSEHVRAALCPPSRRVVCAGTRS